MKDSCKLQVDGTWSCPVPPSGREGAERLFKLISDARLPEGDLFIVPSGDADASRAIALFECETGNVYACQGAEDPRVGSGMPVPTVRIVGALSGQTGQVTIIQPDGSYRRFSRWDRITQGSPAQPHAIVRTLPQCGCGGSLGMPKLFDSFAEMSAYFLCTFALDSM